MTWTVDQMRELLPRAKELKEAQLNELREAIAEYESHAQRCRLRVQELEKRVPADFFDTLIEMDTKAAERRDSDEEQARLFEMRARALDEAYLKGRGILPPERYGEKLLWFTIGGATLGAALVSVVAQIALHGVGQFALLSLIVAVAAVGGAAGYLLFGISFTVDPSLEYSDRWLRLNRFGISRRTLSVPKPKGASGAA